MKNLKTRVIDDIGPEGVAMLQALYSRSAESVDAHVERVKKTGSAKFMQSYYVGYNHKSIADCGSTTVFVENVSLLAAKAIQDWPLYSGQETSTRYIDMSSQPIVDPVGTPESREVLDDWMEFYRANQTRVRDTIVARHPIRDGEDPATYARAANARVFDVLRGFLPAGVTTQLSWHTNLRQASDHLTGLSLHPLDEVKTIADYVADDLSQRYPSSGFDRHLAGVSGVDARDGEEPARRAWERAAWGDVAAYPCGQVARPQFGWPTQMTDTFGDISQVMTAEQRMMLEGRPRGCVLPHYLSDLGQFQLRFLLDFGSFRDIQRQRNGVCRMPTLTTDWGFEPWYLDQLDDALRADAAQLVARQRAKIAKLVDDPYARQYYVALGFRVPCQLTYALPALLYVLELRTSKTVHPTLRARMREFATEFQQRYKWIALHTDHDPDDWTIRRGNQTISAR